MGKFMENIIQIELFKHLNDKEIGELKKRIYEKRYNRNEIIFLEGDDGDSVYFIDSGLIRVYKTGESGREKTLALLGSGEFFGEMALFDNNIRSASVQVLKKAIVFSIDRVNFYNLIQDKPGIALKIIAVLSKRLSEANNQIRDLVFKTVKDRLEVELDNLAEQYGQEIEEGVLIARKITHRELADIVGTTRERITKLLGELMEEGKLKTENRHIILT